MNIIMIYKINTKSDKFCSRFISDCKKLFFYSAELTYNSYLVAFYIVAIKIFVKAVKIKTHSKIMILRFITLTNFLFLL